MIELGKVYRDRPSGFVGTATARTEFLRDTPSVRLTARKGSETLVEVWLSEGRLEIADDHDQIGFG